ncbi:hypothetical protein J4404_02550 [Candidatus Woesearchaeota archaeon]|nr:hypothetical protein [Candidatus Woesearchaeota archaeon]
MDSTLEELMKKIGECKIEHFSLDTKEKKLKLYYKEDFDSFFPRFKAQPRVIDTSSEPYLPYGAGHYAFFEYNGWKISGDVTSHKSKK